MTSGRPDSHGPRGYLRVDPEPVWHRLGIGRIKRSKRRNRRTRCRTRYAAIIRVIRISGLSGLSETPRSSGAPEPLCDMCGEPLTAPEGLLSAAYAQNATSQQTCAGPSSTNASANWTNQLHGDRLCLPPPRGGGRRIERRAAHCFARPRPRLPARTVPQVPRVPVVAADAFVCLV